MARNSASLYPGLRWLKHNPVPLQGASALNDAKHDHDDRDDQ